MTATAGYELLDFGNGRKLERFGPIVLDRACPAADGYKCSSPEAWRTADLYVDAKEPEPAELVLDGAWEVELNQLFFSLKLTPFGHVGLFPEQLCNWRWLQDLVRNRNSKASLRALNLFAYTGGTTMALSAAGVEVVHVDSSQPAVRWARDNVKRNSLDQNPIRWIVEDARKFVSRELRRGNRYDIIVLDPPSYGHGPSGHRWEIEADLFDLLDGCAQLLEPSELKCLLITSHSERPTANELVAWTQQRLQQPASTQRLQLLDATGRGMDAGFYMRSAATQ